jgi:hypothetical protein
MTFILSAPLYLPIPAGMAITASCGCVLWELRQKHSNLLGWSLYHRVDDVSTNYT